LKILRLSKLPSTTPHPFPSCEKTKETRPELPSLYLNRRWVIEEEQRKKIVALVYEAGEEEWVRWLRM
jgi:hypothetical protein